MSDARGNSATRPPDKCLMVLTLVSHPRVVTRDGVALFAIDANCHEPLSQRGLPLGAIWHNESIANCHGKLNDLGKLAFRRLGILPQELRASPLFVPRIKSVPFVRPRGDRRAARARGGLAAGLRGEKQTSVFLTYTGCERFLPGAGTAEHCRSRRRVGCAGRSPPPKAPTALQICFPWAALLW